MKVRLSIKISGKNGLKMGRITFMQVQRINAGADPFQTIQDHTIAI